MFKILLIIFKSDTFIKYFKFGIIAAILIFSFIVFLYVKYLKNDNIELKKDYLYLQNLYKEKILEKEQEIRDVKLQLENEKATNKDKEVVKDSVSKLKQEVIKRGELKDEDNFIIFDF
ncbi:hypothetical protein [Aliarcobacter lanthieri]|uniref:hypothetical protein n=1 Tax=Aliarcobacter lanthieri TaxID=1355374 RepID=UPI003AACE229